MMHTVRPPTRPTPVTTPSARPPPPPFPAHPPPPPAPHPGHDTVGRRVDLLVAGEQPVLLELAAGVEQQLEAVADEELALRAQLVAVADVALLDTRALLVVAVLALAHGESIIVVPHRRAR